mmetsp:Transcript_73935/g.197026  ORF Transcript_73935/g.197026 Transcript_73935/m.197026 type:complete len:252 (-) Transcript_73935:1481-2236(-)
MGSILSAEPTAPWMPHPACRPKPNRIWYPGIRLCSVSELVRRYSAGHVDVSKMMRRKLRSAASAVVMVSPSDRRSGIRQAIWNASPTFLLGHPSFSDTDRCTKSATRLTNTMTSSLRHSVQSVKLRMSQKPKMPCRRLPGMRALTPDSDARLSLMMPAPASPKAICSSVESFMSAAAMDLVSPSAWESLESMLILAIGSAMRPRTMAVMVSSGRMTSWSVSWPKERDEKPSTTVTKATVTRFCTAVWYASW